MLRHLLSNQAHWDKIAVLDEGNCCTYRNLAQKAAAVQRRLPSGTRENIALFLPNSADYIAALFGVWMSGKVAFPLNIQLTEHEIAPLLEQTCVHKVITSSAYRSLFEQQGLFSYPIDLILMEELTMTDLEEPPEIRDIPPGEPIVLLTTSGTTGSAKIVQLSEENIETAVLGFIAYNDYARFDDVEIRYILGTPLSSVYGLLILPVCLRNAFPLVIARGAFTLDTLYSAAEQYGVTHYEGGPAIPILMDQMRGKAIPYDIGTLRFVGFGGSKVSADVLLRLDQAFPHIEFCAGYGMTESAALIARPCKRINPDKRDSIGTAIQNVTVGVEADGAITGAPRAVGELVVKGPNVMLGYYRNEEETRKIIRNGWLYTGDIGYIDEDGDIFICGRKKNVIMVRGFSVYAEEVEASLHGSGLVKDCVIYGETDDTGAELLCADIIPMTEEVQRDDLRMWCSAHLAGYKQPHRIRFTDAISKTVTGKIERGTRKVYEAD